MLAVGFELATFGASAAGSFSIVDEVEDIRSGPPDFTFGVRYVCKTMTKSGYSENLTKIKNNTKGVDKLVAGGGY